MIKLIVFSGVPGSGKTTLSKRLSEENNYVRISMDEGNYARHDDMIDDIVRHLKDGRSVVVDSLYDCEQHRTNLLDSLHFIDCDCICVVMNTPLEECIRRNNTRKNPLPSGLIQCISEHYENPSFGEGWNNIVNVEVKPMFPNCTYCEYYKTCQRFYGARGCHYEKEIIEAIKTGEISYEKETF